MRIAACYGSGYVVLGYPRAFLVHRGLRYELSRPALRRGRIVADVQMMVEAEIPPA